MGLLASLTVGCGDSKTAGPGPTSPTAPVNATLTLAPGQATAVPNTPVTLTFEKVTRDNRCPAAAICITGGEAVIAMTASVNGQQMPLSLVTDGALKSADVDRYRVSLEGLQPYPISSFDEIYPGAYRADVRIVSR
jgi:hypothetical protein